MVIFTLDGPLATVTERSFPSDTAHSAEAVASMDPLGTDMRSNASSPNLSLNRASDLPSSSATVPLGNCEMSHISYTSPESRPIDLESWDTFTVPPTALPSESLSQS